MVIHISYGIQFRSFWSTVAVLVLIPYLAVVTSINFVN